MQERMGWVARMTLPDATRSDRVYPLLQNLDLENLAFATLQGTGETLNIEEMNEDELRRLVLVNLARLSVKGEWNGLLTAGSTSVFSPVLPSDTAAGARYIISQTPPWGSADIGATWNASTASKPFYYPFIAPATGSVTEIGVQFTTAATGSLYVGIYDSDSEGMPNDQLVYATIAVTATGGVYQTSITGSGTLTAGSQYYYSVNMATGGSAPYLMAGTTENTQGLGLGGTVNQNGIVFFDNSAVALAIPPASATASYTYAGQQRPICSLKIA